MCFRKFENRKVCFVQRTDLLVLLNFFFSVSHSVVMHFCLLEKSKMFNVVYFVLFLMVAHGALSQTVTHLTKGVPVQGSVAFSQFQFYRIDINTTYVANNGLKIDLGYTSGRGDIYYKVNSLPALNDYDGKATGSNTGSNLTVSVPSLGRYYIGVYGYESVAKFSLVAKFAATQNVTSGNAVSGVFTSDLGYKVYFQFSVSCLIWLW